MPKKILIMGLSTSGKTTLARSIYSLLYSRDISVNWFNADIIRRKYNDWDFTDVGRMRQCERMIDFAENSDSVYTICDFIAPYKKIRDKFNPDILIWMDTISESKYKDTDIIFEPPIFYDFRIIEKNSDKWSRIIVDKILTLV